MIGDDAYSTKELMELLGLKHRQTFRDNYLLPAMEKGGLVWCKYIYLNNYFKAFKLKFWGR
nr:hypothetical protein [Acetobacterium woodii]